MIERELADKDNTMVESPKKLRDLVTGKLREHDIAITLNAGHHAVRIAVGCRDRSRPVGVNQVESSAKECEHTGVNQGIIVSSLGFWETAKQKAEALGIRCLRMEEATSLDWILPNAMPLFRTYIHQIAWKAILMNRIVEKPRNFILVDKDRNEISKETLNKNILDYLRLFPLENVGKGIRTLRISFDVPGMYLLDCDANKYLNLARLDAEVNREKSFEIIVSPALPFAHLVPLGVPLLGGTPSP